MKDLQQTQRKFSALRQFLPRGSFEQIIVYLNKYPVYLRVTRERKTILGDYRRPNRQNPIHRISVNGTLNPYSFLLTFLHELAHMVTYIQFQAKVNPHGKEWQGNYKMLVSDFLGKDIFPEVVEKAILVSLKSVKAATCSDPQLYRVLKAFDDRKEGAKFVEEIPVNGLFKTEDGRVFKMRGKARTRFHCEEVSTGKTYAFHRMAEVIEIKSQEKK